MRSARMTDTHMNRRPHKKPFLRILLGCAMASGALAPAAMAASFFWPDTVAPCNTSLQACIDGAAAPSIIYIVTDNAVNTGLPGQDVVLDRSIGLVAGNGYRPVFPVGTGIVSAPNVSIEASVRGITLRDAGINLLPSAGGSFTIEKVQFLDNVGSSGINFEAFGTAPVYLRVHDNEYLRRGGAGNFLAVQSRLAPISGEVSFNRVSIPDTDSSAYGILIASTGSGGFDFTVANNEVRSGFAYGGICALSTVATGTAGSSAIRIHGNVMVPRRRGFGSAICVFGGEGAIEARVTHNTIVGFDSAISLITRPFSPPTSTQPISGYVLGNLLAYNDTAFRRDGIAAVSGSQVSNGQNLFFGNGVNFTGSAPATAGTGTITSDPLLYSLQFPYLMAGSPAIGAGNFLSLPAGLPLLDADGTRRFKNVAGGGGNVIDIGAYEFGDDWFNARAIGSNNSLNTLLLSHPSINGVSSARALVTPNFSRGTTTSNAPFGVYFNVSSSLWSIFNQNTATNIPLGAGYSALTPAAGSGLFLHQVAASGPTLSETVLDNAAVNALPEQIVIATSNWNPPGSPGVYNNHNLSVGYAADDRWRIRNSDAVVFPNSAAFNVYAQPPSISAFRHLTSAANTSGDSTGIDNPRLNGFRCAEVMATPLANFGDRRFDVYYSESSGRWRIFSSGIFPEGVSFHVVFSPRQVTECGRAMFASGFEDA